MTKSNGSLRVQEHESVAAKPSLFRENVPHVRDSVGVPLPSISNLEIEGEQSTVGVSTIEPNLCRRRLAVPKPL